jgi:hypothetical protein
MSQSDPRRLSGTFPENLGSQTLVVTYNRDDVRAIPPESLRTDIANFLSLWLAKMQGQSQE